MSLIYLSGFDTSNVEEIDYFVRINSLQKLHLENLQPTKVEYLNGFITNCIALTEIDFTGFNLPNLKSCSTFVGYCKNLETLDLGSLNPTKAYDLKYFLTQNTALKNITFTPGFSPGRDYPIYAQEAPADYTGLTFSENNKKYIAGSGGGRVRFNSMFNGCSALEEIDFANWSLTYDLSEDHSKLSVRYFELESLFRNCKSLVKIRNMDHLITPQLGIMDIQIHVRRL